MDDKRDPKIGDIVVMGGHYNTKNYQKLTSVYFGVIVTFTCNNNPRVTPLPYKHVVKQLTFRPVRRYTFITIDPIVVPKERVLSRGGVFEQNYNHILKVAQKDEQIKNKGVQPRKEKKINFGLGD